ncbi:MAG: signal peptidase I [Planctomycetota bacterium]|jgi:signal peptidase I
MDEKTTIDDRIEEVKERANKRLKLARLVMLILILCAFAFAFVEYGCAGIPSENDAMENDFPGGRTVLYDRLFRYHDGVWPACGKPSANLGRKFIVLFKKKIGTGTSELFSRIVALPGDEIVLRDGKVFVKYKNKKGEEVEASLGLADAKKIPAGKVPDFRFVVLNDNLDSTIPDSLLFGYLRADEIYGRVIVKLPAWLR